MIDWDRIRKSQLTRAATAFFLIGSFTAIAVFTGLKIHEYLLADPHTDKQVGYVWGTFAAAVTGIVRCVGDVVSLLETSDDWIKSKSDLFVKPKMLAGHWVWCLSLTLGLVSLRLISNLPETKGGVVETETKDEVAETNLTIIRTSPLTTYLAAPTLIFRPGKLANRAMPLVAETSSEPPDLFDPESFSVSDGHRKKLDAITSAIAKYCYTKDSETFKVMGFASAVPFQGAGGGPRRDSRVLNWHLANGRAAAMAKALNSSPHSKGHLVFEAHHWDTPDQMEKARDQTFTALQVTFTGDFDHRSALIVNSTGLDCNYLPPLEQGK